MLKARLYHTAGTTLAIPLHTQLNPYREQSGPNINMAMEGNDIQPNVHKANVSVVWRRKTYRFTVFVKNHKRLPLNQAIARLMQDGTAWRGDFVVMKRGLRRTWVNMRSEDKSAEIIDS